MRADLTQGSVLKMLFRLSWPVALAMSLQTAFNVVDAYFVGKIGPDALAAVTMVFPVVFIMFALAVGIGVGSTSLIARSLGHRDLPAAGRAAGQSMLMFAGISVGVVGAGLVFQRDVFALLGASEELLPQVLSYSTWIFAGSPALFAFIAVESILRGQGDMRTPMRAMMVAVALNAVMDPILIFGIGPFPRLEVAGAAIATVFSRMVGVIVLMFWMFRDESRIKARRADFLPDLPVVRDIATVGAPTSANQVMLACGFMFLVRIVAGFDEKAVAAYGLAIRLNQMAILPCLGIGAAVVTLVGQNVGAGKVARAARTAWTAVLCAMIIMESIGLLFVLAPEFYMSIFTQDPTVISVGVGFLRIVPPFYMFIGLSIVLASAFQGSGKGFPALAITTLRVIVLTVPSAYILSARLGLIGIWVAIAGSTVIAGLVSAVWFASGTWRGPVPGNDSNCASSDGG
jgi:putative MATE family efflux protein